MNINYPAVFELMEDDWLMVRFPDVPGCVTNGKNFSDAYEMAEDALGIMLESHIESHGILPARSEPTEDQVVVELSALDSTKLALALELANASVSRFDLAKLLGANEKKVWRIVAVGKEIDVDTLEAAFRAIGRRLSIQVETA